MAGSDDRRLLSVTRFMESIPKPADPVKECDTTPSFVGRVSRCSAHGRRKTSAGTSSRPAFVVHAADWPGSLKSGGGVGAVRIETDRLLEFSDDFAEVVVGFGI